MGRGKGRFVVRDSSPVRLEEGWEEGVGTAVKMVRAEG
jgi:hypothetical protein